MKKLIFVLFLFLLVPRMFSWGSEPLIVEVEVESPLASVALVPFKQTGTRFDKNYLKKLENLLAFDFNHNGKTKIRNDSENSLYKINGEFKEDRLLFSLQSSEKTYSCEVPLKGNYSEDSRAIHALADKIHEQLFGVTGIASTRILFTKRFHIAGKECSDLWECDYTGEECRQVLKDAGYCVTPNYIPPLMGYRSTGIVYVSYKTGQPKIYGGSLLPGTHHPLIRLSGNQLMPTISRQRDYIAFISDTTGNPDLFIQNFDPEKGILGKPRHLYTTPNATLGTPTFSPDGSRIAFVSDKDGTERIYVLTIPPQGTPLKNTPVTLISKFTRGNTAPSWSPDGTKIAYCAKVGNQRQIMVYDFLTGKERQLTNGPENKENPSWAPNSLHLVYNTTDAKACELYMIDLIEGVSHRISSGPGEKRFPCWEPRS